MINPVSRRSPLADTAASMRTRFALIVASDLVDALERVSNPLAPLLPKDHDSLRLARCGLEAVANGLFVQALEHTKPDPIRPAAAVFAEHVTAATAEADRIGENAQQLDPTAYFCDDAAHLLLRAAITWSRVLRTHVRTMPDEAIEHAIARITRAVQQAAKEAS